MKKQKKQDARDIEIEKLRSQIVELTVQMLELRKEQEVKNPPKKPATIIDYGRRSGSVVLTQSASEADDVKPPRPKSKDIHRIHD